MRWHAVKKPQIVIARNNPSSQRQEYLDLALTKQLTDIELNLG